MICYKDMTFCDAYPTKCINSDCSRVFTDQNKIAAAKWWGGDDAPVAFADFFDNCSSKVTP